jgi:hypothetical protein
MGGVKRNFGRVEHFIRWVRDILVGGPPTYIRRCLSLSILPQLFVRPCFVTSPGLATLVPHQVIFHLQLLPTSHMNLWFPITLVYCIHIPVHDDYLYQKGNL